MYICIGTTFLLPVAKQHFVVRFACTFWNCCFRRFARSFCHIPLKGWGVVVGVRFPFWKSLSRAFSICLVRLLYIPTFLYTYIYALPPSLLFIFSPTIYNIWRYCCFGGWILGLGFGHFPSTTFPNPQPPCLFLHYVLAFTFPRPVTYSV